MKTKLKKINIIKLTLLFSLSGFLSIGFTSPQHKDLKIYDIKYSETNNVMNCLKVTWKVKNNSNDPLSIPTMKIIPEKTQKVADTIAKTKGVAFAGNPIATLSIPVQHKIVPKESKSYETEICANDINAYEDDVKIKNIERVLVSFY